ncbi:hypothetical protein C8Q80DRAFT_1264832 [Daedaleopsis nitida]|nr:hypothetical protein C8Q80DRAFT_1264832 [Daedaleopsis nitida]
MQHVCTELPVINQDVLGHIFEHGPMDKTLCGAAAVCKAWYSPAQAALYREIFFFPLDNRPRDVLLARTMRTCPHLRRHVRRLSLITLWTHSPTPELCDWIQCLPSHSLHDFQWTWIRGEILPAIIASPAISTISSIQLRGRLYSVEKLGPILDLPYLKTLSLELTGHETGDLPPPGFSRLLSLRIHLSLEYGPVFDKLLSAVGSCLESLHLTHKICFDPDKDWALFAAIETNCPALTSLAIHAPFGAGQSIPIVDRLLRQYGHLERLSCSEGAYTVGMFESIPPSLKILELSINGSSLPYHSVLLELLARVRMGQRQLKALAFTCQGPLDGLKIIANACRESGVAFCQNTEPYHAG